MRDLIAVMLGVVACGIWWRFGVKVGDARGYRRGHGQGWDAAATFIVAGGKAGRG